MWAPARSTTGSPGGRASSDTIIRSDAKSNSGGRGGAPFAGGGENGRRVLATGILGLDDFVAFESIESVQSFKSKSRRVPIHPRPCEALVAPGARPLRG